MSKSRPSVQAVQQAQSKLTDNDRARSATSSGIPALLDALGPLAGKGIGSLLDIGCGFGGLTRVAGDVVGATDLHGVDIDGSVVDEAAGKDVTAVICDVEENPLPYEDGSFDLVMSLGMLDYLPTFDALLSEIRRVLRPGGYALLSIPNLGSWNNRLALLFGYQPRDVEISERRVVGAAPYYRDRTPSGHLHVPTLKAFAELMDITGFDQYRVSGGSWMTRDVFGPLAVIDGIVARRPSLARRFFYVGTRSDREVEQDQAGWWKGREALREAAARGEAVAE